MLRPRRPMQKWSALVFAAVTAAFVAVVFLGRAPKGKPAPAPSTSASAVVDAGVADASTGPRDAGAEPAPTGTEENPGGQENPFPTTDAGATLIDGTVPPGLGADSPKSVVFGVILVQ